MELLDRCIQQKKIELERHKMAGTEATPDVFTALVSSANRETELSDQEMKEAALELLFAGHGTTASAACSLLLQLGRNASVCGNFFSFSFFKSFCTHRPNQKF